jgi:hypothetical protein
VGEVNHFSCRSLILVRIYKFTASSIIIDITMGAMSTCAFAFIGLLGLLGQSLAAPLVVSPGDAKDIIITNQDTLNGTLAGSGIAHKPDIINANANLPLTFTNNFSGGAVNVYVTGLDPNSEIVFLQSNGQWYYPPSTTSTTPVAITGNIVIPLGGQGSFTTVTLPNYISSGRIWVSEGNLQFFVVDAGGTTGLVEPSAVNPSDPSAGINWGFVELTNNNGGIYADVSYVDFVGMPLGISLSSSDGSVQTAQGVTSNAVSSICSALEQQGNSDGQPWGELCVTDSAGNPIRVLAPSDYITIQNNAFSNYWTNYVNQVWSHYTSNTLTIDTQASYGDISCTVSGSTLNCAGDNAGYSKPTAGDIFGCNSGPFAISSSDNVIHQYVVPRLCAAFDRSTLLLSGGNVQPQLSSSSYYTVAPTNYYAKFVHENEVDGKGYAFAYDDVTPTGATSAAGVVSDGNPTRLTVIIGGPL